MNEAPHDALIAHYDWRGGREGLLRFGPAGHPQVVFALPPFEDANRLRAIVLAAARTLASRGLGVIIPDLPGMGESLTAIGDTVPDDWRAALGAVMPADAILASVRAAALFDDVAARAHWRLSPIDGARLVREMLRSRIAGAREQGEAITMAELTEQARAQDTSLSGHDVSARLFQALEAAKPGAVAPLRVVRLAGDAQGADAQIDRPPPWRRAEPGGDRELSEALVDDIEHWVSACAG